MIALALQPFSVWHALALRRSRRIVIRRLDKWVMSRNRRFEQASYRGNQACIFFSSVKSPEVLTLPVMKALVPPSLPLARST